MTNNKVEIAKHREQRLELLMKIGSSTNLFALGVIYALIYHSAVMITFYFAGVRPLFYLNIASVLLYAFLVKTVRTYDGKTWPYLCTFGEVLLHQVIATFLLGSEPSFFFLILPIGTMGMLILDHRFWSSVGTGFAAMVIFIVFYICGPNIEPVYSSSKQGVNTFRYINVISAVLMIFWCLFTFTVRTSYVSDQLEMQIRVKTRELNAKNQKVTEIQQKMIYSLANLVENRDEDTGKHVIRTSKYVEMIAVQTMRRGFYLEEIDGKYIENLVKAAPLHDIGKITIPDSILKKPGKLTAEEFELMKTHATEGARIINNILDVSEDRDYIDVAVDIAKYHHEKWNGEGYPAGLSGEDIPLCARIMAIADVFDALISTRCYKDALPYDKAFAIIEEEKGRHFDPVLVDMFLSMKDRIVDAD